MPSVFLDPAPTIGCLERHAGCAPHVIATPKDAHGVLKWLSSIEEKRMSKIIRLASILFIIIFILAACNLPTSNPATEDPNAVFTAAALTVQAMSTFSTTQVTPFNTPTIPPPAPTNTSAASFPTLALPTATRAAPPTPVCDQAQFVRDVTIPDGTVFAPGATFTKTWRIKNAGTCTWSGYSLVFDSGDSMGGA